ncbi:hypothetical protein BCR43DRAFT_492668 [Syncephalastrum racemosum]|uniref:Uncharacterized protein n=1 Tax=Syncephalastrum racemosum TaxID=13706 RepID=A0A1X2H9D2_SYNRA|nr:hypothetical protein BCR43DRAFT_492668 [Syncephalastrum racemosum]
MQVGPSFLDIQGVLRRCVRHGVVTAKDNDQRKQEQEAGQELDWMDMKTKDRKARQRVRKLSELMLNRLPNEGLLVSKAQETGHRTIVQAFEVDPVCAHRNDEAFAEKRLLRQHHAMNIERASMGRRKRLRRDDTFVEVRSPDMETHFGDFALQSPADTAEGTPFEEGSLASQGSVGMGAGIPAVPMPEFDVREPDDDDYFVVGDENISLRFFAFQERVLEGPRPQSLTMESHLHHLL